MIINIVSKDDVTSGNIPHYTCMDFIKMSSETLGKKRNGCIIIIVHHVLKFLYTVDYESNKFIHRPSLTYKETMQLLELVGVDKCE